MLACACLGVPIAPTALLQNGGFELGIDSWEVRCSAPAKCGQAAPSGAHSLSGASALSFSSGAGEWVSSSLHQRLSSLPTRTVRFTAWIRSNVRTAPALLRLRLEFEPRSIVSNASAVPSCEREWIDLPSSSDWERHELLCTPPIGAQHAWASIHFACVRADASLLVDDVSVAELPANDSGGDGNAGAPAQVAGERAVSVPRRLHFIFGLARGFGGKPFSLVHFLVVRAAARFFRPDALFFHHVYEVRPDHRRQQQQQQDQQRYHPPPPPSPLLPPPPTPPPPPPPPPPLPTSTTNHHHHPSMTHDPRPTTQHPKPKTQNPKPTAHRPPPPTTRHPPLPTVPSTPPCIAIRRVVDEGQALTQAAPTHASHRGL